MFKNVIQIYALIVCITSIICIFICVGMLTSAAYISYAGYEVEAKSGYRGEMLRDTISFRQHVSMRSCGHSESESVRVQCIDGWNKKSDDEIKQMMQERIDAEIVSVKHENGKKLFTSSVMFVFALFIFFIHWRLVRRETDGV